MASTSIQKAPGKLRIGIVGGGWTGLVLAYRMACLGHHVTIFERSAQLGGLATYHDFGTFFWDKFYHVILPTDKALIEFIHEIGLDDKLKWKNTLTGFYVDKNFYSVSTTWEFLQFPPLNLWQKFRLGLTILWGSRINDWKKLEKISVEQWLKRYSGTKTYLKFWKPLLLAKLGESYRRVSAVFIWTYIKRLYRAREDSSAKKEMMGYLSGGYKTALDHLKADLVSRDVDLRLNCYVEKIEPGNEGVDITADGKKMNFDKVIFTGPVDALERVSGAALATISRDTSKIEYLGVICVVVNLKKPITPFYVLNIADDSIPFTGVIGMSTLVDTAETGGKHMIYLPKYVISTDPIFQKSDEEIMELFTTALLRMYPELEKDDFDSIYVNRARKVQPLQVLNYSQLVPEVRSGNPNFFVLNTSQFVNDTLNNDSVVRHVNRFMEVHSTLFSDAEVKRHKALKVL